MTKPAMHGVWHKFDLNKFCLCKNNTALISAGTLPSGTSTEAQGSVGIRY